jgi:hypothetical protein
MHSGQPFKSVPADYGSTFFPRVDEQDTEEQGMNKQNSSPC